MCVHFLCLCVCVVHRITEIESAAHSGKRENRQSLGVEDLRQNHFSLRKPIFGQKVHQLGKASVCRG